MRFWNPESGKQITSKMIDVLTDTTKEEQKVMLVYVKKFLKSAYVLDSNRIDMLIYLCLLVNYRSSLISILK